MKFFFLIILFCITCKSFGQSLPSTTVTLDTNNGRGQSYYSNVISDSLFDKIKNSDREPIKIGPGGFRRGIPIKVLLPVVLPCLIVLGVTILLFGRVPKKKRRVIDTESVQPIEKVARGVVGIQFNKFVYECEEGEIIVDQEYSNPNIGEYVYLNNFTAPDGKYKIGFLKHIKVKDGKVA
jgi:hypothetical protein